MADVINVDLDRVPSASCKAGEAIKIIMSVEVRAGLTSVYSLRENAGKSTSFVGDDLSSNTMPVLNQRALT